jgi:predicted dehydrogenase
MQNRIIRWGIVGTGHAREFARALGALPNARLVAVASRTQEKANAFGEEFGLAHRHASVAALAANPEVDVVYVGSSPRHHAAHARECLHGGKGVLVEKPFTINAAEAEAVRELARAKGLFCMEALWSRFLPATQDVARWLAEGRIGAVRQVIADFGFCAEWDPKARYFDPEQCGGCLLDVGVYALAFAAMALGETPGKIVAQATLCPTGVDEQTAMVLGYAGGGLALLSCANRTRLPHRGCIVGTEGRIEVEGFVWAHGATLRRDGEEPLVVEPKLPLPAYSYQATETMRCLVAGLTESPLLPMTEVIARMRIMDEVRRQVGVAYPSVESGMAAAC